MSVNFNGYGENVVTFVADSSITEAGVPVKITADNTVGACSSAEAFCGICVGLRDGYAAVQLSGYAEVATASKLALGYTKLAAGADGKVAVNTTNGREILVLNSTSGTAGIVL